MNQNLLKDTEYAKRIASHQLMTQFVKDNAEDVANSICELAPFLCGECSISDLQESLNTVNVTFATVALDVINSRNVQNDPESQSRNPRCLPVDAIEMQNALCNFSRFMRSFAAMASLIERNEKMPAFRMSISAYDKVDSL